MNARSNLSICHDCDLLQREPAEPSGAVVKCVRCGAVLYRCNPGNRERTLALTLAAAVLFLIANAFPIVGIETQGQHNASTLLGAVLTLWRDHDGLVALLVLVTTVLAPATEIAMMIAVLAARRPSIRLLRWLPAIRPWAMIEVFVLGLLVSIQKLSHLAILIPGVALWSFIGLMLLLAAKSATFNARDVWQSVSLSEPRRT
jgi:paraquat-inducible protein A